MWGDAELEEWAEEQVQRIEEEEKNEEKLETTKKSFAEVPVRRVLRESASPSKERVCFGPGQEVRISFRIWPNVEGKVVIDPEDLTVERFQVNEVVVSGESVRYEPRSCKSENHLQIEDDLDEWLGLPPKNEIEHEWTRALDAALESGFEGEDILYESNKWRCQVEIEAVMYVREVVDPRTPVAQHGLCGFARCKRMRQEKNGTEADFLRRPADGTIVQGQIRKLKGMANPKAFGVKSAWSSLDEDQPFEVHLGEGEIAEAFEAALLHCGKIGNILRLAAAGETLLHDNDHEDASNLIGRYDNEIVVEICIKEIDESNKREIMKMKMDEKIARADILRARGSKLWTMGRKRRAEMIWHDGTRLFSFIKPEDSAFDPTDVHMKENETGRMASIPLLLNEALAMRARGAIKDARINLDEALDYDPNHAKALFRRGQIFVDLQLWDHARYDLARCLDLTGGNRDLDNELARLRRLQRRQDAKDGKYFKDAFADDRQAIYDDVDLDPTKMAKARQELRDWAKKQELLAKQKKEGNTPTLKREHTTPAWDWTASYSTKDRPKLVSTTAITELETKIESDVVKIDDLQAEIEELDEEEEEARRLAKQEYYNTQIGLGNMRIQVPESE